MCIRHSCSSACTKSAVKVYTHTDASLHWLLLRVLLLVPMGSFLPLFSSIPAEREGEKKTHLHYFYVEQNFAVSLMPAWEILSARHYMWKYVSVISKAYTHFSFYKFSDLFCESHQQKLEQVPLLQLVAQGHRKTGHIAVGGNETVAVVGNKLVPVSQDMFSPG